MTYKGDDRFRTCFGAFLSVMFWIVLILMIAYQALMYVQNLNSSVSNFTLQNDANFRIKPFQNENDMVIKMVEDG